MTKFNADTMTYDEAIRISEQLPEYSKLLPVGSVASEQPFPNDLDFLTKLNLKPLSDKFINKFPLIWNDTKLGKKRFDYYPIINGKRIVINIWKTSDRDLPFFYLAYGYPRGFAIALKKRAKTRGYKLSQYGLFDRNSGERLNINTIIDVFSFLDLPFRTPKEEYLKHKSKKIKMKGGRFTIDPNLISFLKNAKENIQKKFGLKK